MMKKLTGLFLFTLLAAVLITAFNQPPKKTSVDAISKKIQLSLAPIRRKNMFPISGENA